MFASCSLGVSFTILFTTLHIRIYAGLLVGRRAYLFPLFLVFLSASWRSAKIFAENVSSLSILKTREILMTPFPLKSTRTGPMMSEFTSLMCPTLSSPILLWIGMPVNARRVCIWCSELCRCSHPRLVSSFAACSLEKRGWRCRLYLRWIRTRRWLTSGLARLLLGACPFV